MPPKPPQKKNSGKSKIDSAKRGRGGSAYRSGEEVVNPRAKTGGLDGYYAKSKPGRAEGRIMSAKIIGEGKSSFGKMKNGVRSVEDSNVRFTSDALTRPRVKKPAKKSAIDFGPR